MRLSNKGSVVERTKALVLGTSLFECHRCHVFIQPMFIYHLLGDACAHRNLQIAIVVLNDSTIRYVLNSFFFTFLTRSVTRGKSSSTDCLLHGEMFNSVGGFKCITVRKSTSKYHLIAKTECKQVIWVNKRNISMKSPAICKIFRTLVHDVG